MNRHHYQRQLEAIAQELGFTRVRRKRHQVWRHPNGAQVITASTPSDRRALMEVRTTFRRAAAITTPSLRATA